MNRSTIVGVATGSPDGGVAIVRLSGPGAATVCAQMGLSPGPPRRLVRRALALPSGAAEDLLFVWMPGPASFTGEDVAELHVHGGHVNVREIVERCLAAGARAAQAGDFSRRAFEHGRMTLAQSEGVAALIGAQTRAGAAQARRLVGGELGQQVDALAALVGRLRVEVEAYVDFPDDVDGTITVQWRHRIAEGIETIDDWLNRFELGRRAREVPRVVLVGAPNAGKSSLLNALVGNARALVADQPGTTRDYVEVRLELGNHAVMLVDTAGLRSEGAGEIEAAGIELARSQARSADLMLWVSPARAEGSSELLGPRTDAEVWTVRSKSDLTASSHVESAMSAEASHAVSVHDPDSVDALREAIATWLRGSASPWVGLARHRDRARESRTALREAFALLSEEGGDAPLELLAFPLQVAQARLDEIVGRQSMGPVGAEVLDAIFSTFCIGK